MENIKFKERKAFNFYRSYYETSLLLDGKDKAEFLECIINYQFTGILIEPKRKNSLLAFRGQIHSINKQIIGFDKGKDTYPNGYPTEGKYKGKGKGSHKEVQEQVQEEEQVQDEVEEKEEIIDVPAKAEKIDFEKLIEFINKNTGRNFKVINKTVKGKYLARLKEGYSKQDILDAVSNSIKSDFHKGENFKYLTPEFFSRSETLDKYSNVNNKPKENNVKSLIPKGVSFSGPQY
jgi:uncharacterized phage protein (TIGR02220 family)